MSKPKGSQIGGIPSYSLAIPLIRSTWWMRRRVMFAWKVCQQDCQVSVSKRNREASIETDFPRKTGTGHLGVILSSLLVIPLASAPTPQTHVWGYKRVDSWNKLSLEYLQSIDSTRYKCCRDWY